MNARENIAAHFTSDVLADELLDAYRTEVLAEAKAETVAWLVKKVREYRATGSSQHRLQADAIATLASKVDRGAVRAFIGTKHYRDAMDAHRVEVLREAANMLVAGPVDSLFSAPAAWVEAIELLRRVADDAESGGAR